MGSTFVIDILSAPDGRGRTKGWFVTLDGFQRFLRAAVRRGRPAARPEHVPVPVSYLKVSPKGKPILEVRRSGSM